MLDVDVWNKGENVMITLLEPRSFRGIYLLGVRVILSPKREQCGFEVEKHTPLLYSSVL